MTQLDDNLDSLAAGDSGAPNIETAAITDLAVTTAKIANDNITIAKLDASLEADHLNGIIRGWVTYDNTGTATILDSFNVTSVTDSGVGDFDIVWATDFANTSYCVVGMSSLVTGLTMNGLASNARAVGSTGLQNIQEGASTVDADFNYVMAIGDQ